MILINFTMNLKKKSSKFKNKVILNQKMNFRNLMILIRLTTKLNKLLSNWMNKKKIFLLNYNKNKEMLKIYKMH